MTLLDYHVFLQSIRCNLVLSHNIGFVSHNELELKLMIILICSPHLLLFQYKRCLAYVSLVHRVCTKRTLFPRILIIIVYVLE